MSTKPLDTFQLLQILFDRPGKYFSLDELSNIVKIQNNSQHSPEADTTAERGLESILLDQLLVLEEAGLVVVDENADQFLITAAGCKMITGSAGAFSDRARYNKP